MGSTWVTHMLPRLFGPGAPYHSYGAFPEAPYRSPALRGYSFGLILACALAADTPTIIARTLNPPIKACFISLPPFGQENATLFIGSITGNKVKAARGCGTQISGHRRGKIRINAGAVRTCEGSRSRLTRHASREADGLALAGARKPQPRGPARCPACSW